MSDITIQKLEQLRVKVLDDLANMSDQLVSNDAIGFETLLAIARNTGKVELLEKALHRAEAIEEGSDKAAALLDVLDEVDFQLNLTEANETDNEDQVEQASDTPEAAPEQAEQAEKSNSSL